MQVLVHHVLVKLCLVHNSIDGHNVDLLMHTASIHRHWFAANSAKCCAVALHRAMMAHLSCTFASGSWPLRRSFGCWRRCDQALTRQASVGHLLQYFVLSQALTTCCPFNIWSKEIRPNEYLFFNMLYTKTCCVLLASPN